jgi:hypothetical protein
MDNLHITILPGGLVKVETDRISAPNHLSAGQIWPIHLQRFRLAEKGYELPADELTRFPAARKRTNHVLMRPDKPHANDRNRGRADRRVADGCILSRTGKLKMEIPGTVKAGMQKRY